MRKITENQKEFLITCFFNSEYPGAKGIAEKLLDTGKCIVAGEKCIWSGGVGNFIKTSPYEDAIGCSLYELDLEMLLNSEWVKETRIHYLNILSNDMDDIEIKLNNLRIKYNEVNNM